MAGNRSATRFARQPRRTAALALLWCLFAACTGPGGTEEALRELLAREREAHLTTDAELLTSGVADTLTSVADGSVTRQTRADVAATFTRYFAGARYDVWDDEAPPLVRVSPDGKMGWVSRQVRVQRDEAALGRGRRQIEFVSAWTATYEWSNGDWRMTSVTSTFLPPDSDGEQILSGATRALGSVGRPFGASARASVQGPDGDFEVTVHSARDGRARIEFNGGLVAAIGLEDSWVRDNLETEVTDLEPVTLTFLRGHEVHWLALAPESRYAALTYAGHAEFEGSDALTLFATDELGGDVRLYFSTADTVPLGYRVVDHVRGGPDPILVYGQWETLDGIRVPRSAEFRQGDDVFRYRFTDIHLVEALPDSLFARP